jgi:hypothetical protein
MEKRICTLLDFWSEKNGILSVTQYGFRKEKGTRDCLAMLTTDNSTSDIIKQSVVAFLDISGAYDSVLIVWCDARKGAASGNCPIAVV